MGFFGGKENGDSIHATHHVASFEDARRFGTPLRSNVDRSKRNLQSGAKKKVKVRRSPQPMSTNNSKATMSGKMDAANTTPRLSIFGSANDRNGTEKTVVFSPGPVGLQLEPVNNAPIYGCRVARFVDGGPNNPGQARQSGKIKPGDLVLKVEAEGTLMAATTYDAIIDLLKLSHVKRIITVQSVWESNPESKTPLANQNFIPTKRKSNSSVKNSQKHRQRLLASGEKLNSAMLSQQFETEHEVVFHSPFQNDITASSENEESGSHTSPIRNRATLALNSNAPVILSLQPETRQSQSCDNVIDPSKDSVLSQETTLSSNKSLGTPPRQALADQFLLFDGVMGTFEPESSLMSTDSGTSGESDLSDSRSQQNLELSNQNEILGSCHLRSEQKEQKDQRKQISSKLEMAKQQTLFEDSLARADFEQRLQIMRMEHAKTERELKDLYLHTCERNENKIRELQVNNDVLQKTLEDAEAKQELVSNKRIKELEMQVAEAQKLRFQTQVEARERIETKSNEFSRLVKMQEDRLLKRILELENENVDLRDEAASKSLELEMARTMVTEMESRILQTETEKDQVINRLESASHSIQELEESILLVKEDDKDKNGRLLDTQRKLDEVLKEKKALIEEIEGYESFKEESSVLTEKLANSVQEKQKALAESQTVAQKLESENDSLTKQIAEANNDVEQLLQEKLILEDKLALTWKDIERAKNDASTIHETLLEKLENGEYFTSADVEEKEIAIEALTNELDLVKETSKDQIIKAHKMTLNFHLRLKVTERRLYDLEQLKLKVDQERDILERRNNELEIKARDYEKQVTDVTELYRNEKSVAEDLSVQLETMSRSKEEEETRYKAAIESLSIELEKTNKKLTIAENSFDDMKAHKDDAIANIEELRVEIAAVTKSKKVAEEDYQQSIESLSLELESKKSELSSCEDEFENMKSVNEKQVMISINLQSQLESLEKVKQESDLRFEKSIQSLKSDMEEKRKELLALEEKMQQTEKERDDAIATGEELKLHIEALEKSSAKSNEEHQKAVDELSAIIDRKMQEISSYEKDLARTESQKEEAITRGTTLEIQLDAAMKAKKDSDFEYKKSLESVTLELETKQKELTTQQERFENEKCELEDHVSLLKEEKDQLVAELSDKVHELESMLQKEQEKVLSSEATEKKLLQKLDSMGLERAKEIEVSEEKIKNLTSELQSQCEELSCMEMRLDILEEDNDTAHVALDEAMEKIDILEEEKKDVEAACQNEIEKVKSEHEAHVALLEASSSDLKQRLEVLIAESMKEEAKHKNDIEKLEKKLEIAEVRHCQEIERLSKEHEQENGRQQAENNNLRSELQTTRRQHQDEVEKVLSEHEVTKSQLSEVSSTMRDMEAQGISASKIEELETTIKSLKSENESATTQYWEGMQELTGDIQSRNEELLRKQSVLDDMEEELGLNLIKMHEMEQELFENNVTIGDLRSQVASQAKLLSSVESEKASKEEIIANLHSRISRSQKDHSEEQEKLVDSVKGLETIVSNLKTSKEKLSIESCSEIFRLVKRLAILEHSHSDVKDQRLKAMEIAQIQSRWQHQAQSEVEILQKKLEVTSKRALQLENDLNEHYIMKEQAESVVVAELSEKNKEVEHQRLMISSLQAEISAMIVLTKNLEDTKEKEMSILRAEKEELESSLSSEKQAHAESASYASDARMELKILHKKYNSMTSSKNEALSKSEEFSKMIARSLFQANAVIATLHIQIKEKDLDLRKAVDEVKQLKSFNEDQSTKLKDSTELSLELENARASIAELKSSLHEAKRNAETLQESYEATQSSERNIRSELSRRMSQLYDALNENLTDNSNDHETNDAATSDTHFEIISTKIRSLVDENSSLTESMESLRSEKYIAEELVGRSMKTIDVLHGTVSELRGKIASKDSDLELLSDELRSAEATLRHTEMQLQRAELEHQNAVHKFKKQSEKLESEIKVLRENKELNEEKLSQLQQANKRIQEETRELNLSIANNNKEYEDLQSAMKTLEKNLLSEEGRTEEVETLRKKELKERTRLLKNIEDLSVKLMSLEESQKQSEISYKDAENALKKSLSKLRAEFVVKHLEANELKKKLVVLGHSSKKVKKNMASLNRTIEDLKLELEKSKVELSRSEAHAKDLTEEISVIQETTRRDREMLESRIERHEKELIEIEEKARQANNLVKQLEDEKVIVTNQLTEKNNKFEALLSTKGIEVGQLQQQLLSLRESLNSAEEKLKAEESARKAETELNHSLREKATNLSSRFAILDREKNTLSEKVLRQQAQLQMKEEKLSKDIAEEMTRLREHVSVLSTENFGKSNLIAELRNTLESTTSRLDSLTEQKNDVDRKLDIANSDLVQHQTILEDHKKQLLVLREERSILERNLNTVSHRLEEETEFRFNEVTAMREEYDSLKSMNTALREEKASAKKRTLDLEIQLNELKQFHEKASRSDPPVVTQNEVSGHLSSVKDAFHKQSALLEDVKLSETMLESLMNEVMNIASQSEAEMLELSSTLGTVNDLHLNPSSLLASLDLAGLDSSDIYFREVRSRLEDLAALAYNTGVELNNRQNQLVQWKSNRAESPELPMTPPSVKYPNRIPLTSTEGESTCDITPVVTDGAREIRDKLAGARLLSCVLENHSKMELASAFRKWTCAAGVLSSATSHKQTAAELSHELEITREKLVTLKNHLKTGRSGKQGGKQKPRLRRILERLDGNSVNHNNQTEVNGKGSNSFQIHSERKNCSFGI